MAEYPEIQLDQKFDGFRVQIHSDGKGKVQIWSEDGGDVMKRFPKLIADVKKNTTAMILDAEITGEKDGKHIGRSDVSGYAHKKDEPDDEAFQANCFDCVYYGEDIHKQPLSERRKALEKVKTGKHLKVAETKVAGSEAEVRKALTYFSKKSGSEGAMLKLFGSPYPLSGHTGDWMKFKKEADIDAEVIETHKVKGTDAYNYLCVIRRGAIKVPIGRTYNVRFEREGKSVQVPIGGIIRVAFVNLNRYTDSGTGEVWYNWWAPRAIEYREDKKAPDTTDTADTIVQKTGGEVEEKPYPKRYKVALDLKEGVVRDYEDWLTESYPRLYDLDEYDYKLLETLGEDDFQRERIEAVKEAEELGLFWDDYVSPESLEDHEKQREEAQDTKAPEELHEQVRDIPVKDSTKDNLWEHHWRKTESVHLDHRFKVNDHLNGWTLSDQPETGEVRKARETLGIEGDVDTEAEAKKLEDYFIKNKMWKFDPTQPEKKVLAFPKASQPVGWLRFEGKVEPGEVGATEVGAGYFLHIEKGQEKEFGTQKVYFKEYFENGNRFKGRWVIRKIPARKEWEKVGKGKLVWMAWFTKDDFESQIPYLITRRGRQKRDYVPTFPLSGLNKEWRERVPEDLRWWTKRREKAEINSMIDKAFNYFAENIKEFPFAKLKIQEAVKDVKWTLSKAWWKGATVVRGMPKQHFEMFLDFGEPKLQRFETDDNLIFQDASSGILVTETAKPEKNGFKDWLKFEGSIPAAHPKNPNKKLDMNYDIIDQGTAKLIEKKDNFIHLDFKGKQLKGLRILKREDPGSDIWIWRKSAAPGELR